MSRHRFAVFVLSFLTTVILPAAAGSPSTSELLTGLKYHPGSESLSGKLVFLSWDDYRRSNSLTAASLYELDLRTGKLLFLTKTPNGILTASGNGDLFCVLPYSEQPLQLFIFSKSTGRTNNVSLSSPPEQVQLVGRHVFFTVRSAGEDNLVDFDFESGTSQNIELPGASKSQYRDIKSLSVGSAEQSLHFEYKSFGKLLADGKHYNNGFYDLQTKTRELRWSPVQTTPRYEYRSADGQYVFFKGRDAPIEGYELKISPTPDYEEQKQKAKRLTSFSKLEAIVGGVYHLHCISPDGRYSLVKFEKPVDRKIKAPSAPVFHTGLRRTYYVVDLSTGKSRKLLEDDVMLNTVSELSDVFWIRGR